MAPSDFDVMVPELMLLNPSCEQEGKTEREQHLNIS